MSLVLIWKGKAAGGSVWLWFRASARACRGCWRFRGCVGSWSRVTGCISRLLAWGSVCAGGSLAHLKHADLVLEAFHEVRRERLRSPCLTWRRAQEVVAGRWRNAVLTGTTALAA